MCSYLSNCRKKCKFLGTATQDSSDCCYLWGMTNPSQLYVLILCNKFAHFFSFYFLLWFIWKHKKFYKLGFGNISLFIERWLTLIQAISGSVIRNSVLAWCLQKKGPVYVSLFKPLGTAIAVVMAIIFLGEIPHLGR